MHSVFCAMATAAERKAKLILEFQALADSDSRAILLEYWLYKTRLKRIESKIAQEAASKTQNTPTAQNTSNTQYTSYTQSTSKTQVLL